MLGLVVALPDEARTLFGSGGWQQTGRWRIFRAVLPDGTDLTCVRSGMGEQNALAAAHWLVGQQVAALAVLGVSGGLHPALTPGDLVLAESMLAADGTTAEPSALAAPAFLDSVAETLAAKSIAARRGCILSRQQPVLAVAEKKALHRRYGLLAADMETGAVARVAHEAQLPFFALRSVCDPARREVPRELFEILDSRGQVRWPALLGKLCRRPGLAVEMVALRRDYAAALAGLRQGWLALLEHRLTGRLVRGTDHQANLPRLETAH